MKFSRALSKDEARRLFGWGRDIFHGARYNLQWRGTDLHCVLSSYGKPATHVGILRHVVRVRGRSVVVAGVGGVVTAPLYQWKGYASLAMKETQQFIMKKMRIDFGLLFCPDRLKPFYAQLGWRPIQAPVFIDQSTDQIRMPLNTMVLRCHSRKWPKGTIFLRSAPW